MHARTHRHTQNTVAQLQLKYVLFCNLVFLKRDISRNEDVISDGN